jgi:hypothetical protein
VRVTKLRLLILVLAACIQSAAFAHGLLARVRANGDTLVGTAYYSSGEVAGGEWVEIFDITGDEVKVAGFAADADGNFLHAGAPGHRYRISVHGDEGHSIDLEISLARGARANLVERGAISPAGLPEIPAWAVVGGALLIASLVALPFKFRQRRRILAPRRWK